MLVLDHIDIDIYANLSNTYENGKLRKEEKQNPKHTPWSLNNWRSGSNNRTPWLALDCATSSTVRHRNFTSYIWKSFNFRRKKNEMFETEGNWELSQSPQNGNTEISKLELSRHQINRTQLPKSAENTNPESKSVEVKHTKMGLQPPWR